MFLDLFIYLYLVLFFN